MRQFRKFVRILTIENTVMETGDIWDTDYNSDNWEPEFMTIIVFRTINCDTGQHSQFLRCFLWRRPFFCMKYPFFVWRSLEKAFETGWKSLNLSPTILSSPHPFLIFKSAWRKLFLTEGFRKFKLLIGHAETLGILLDLFESLTWLHWAKSIFDNCELEG